MWTPSSGTTWCLASGPPARARPTWLWLWLWMRCLLRKSAGLSLPGQRWKPVIAGDVTQIDLPNGRRSGLVEAMDIVSKVEGISFVYFTERDVVRHSLVQRIIRAYEDYESSKAESRTGKTDPGNGRPDMRDLK